MGETVKSCLGRIRTCLRRPRPQQPCPGLTCAYQRLRRLRGVTGGGRSVAESRNGSRLTSRKLLKSGCERVGARQMIQSEILKRRYRKETDFHKMPERTYANIQMILADTETFLLPHFHPIRLISTPYCVTSGVHNSTQDRHGCGGLGRP